MANSRRCFEVCCVLVLVVTLPVRTLPRGSPENTDEALRFGSKQADQLHLFSEYQPVRGNPRELSTNGQPAFGENIEKEDSPDEVDVNRTRRDFRCETVPASGHSPFDYSPCQANDSKLERVFNRNLSSIWKHCRFKDTNETIPGCYCLGNLATCCHNLTAIPSFQEEVLYVNFARNALTHLDDDSLRNVTQIQWLILNNNPIYTVTQNAFQNMTSLRCLDISFNEISPLDPVNFTISVNKIPTLRSLSLNYTQFEQVNTTQDGKRYLIRNLNTTTLEYLFLKGGHMKKIYLSDLHKLTKLKEFSVRKNTILQLIPCSSDSFTESISDSEQTGTDFCENFSLPNLKRLDLAYNWLVQFPIFCQRHEGRNESHTVLPALTDLLLSVCAIIDPNHSQMTCLPNLKSLALPGNPLRRIRRRVFQGFPRLTELDLRYTNVLHAEAQAFNHSRLRHLSIKSSNWFFDRLQLSVYNMSKNLFQGSSLETVDLSYNVFRYVKKKRLNTILRPLKSVKKLLMYGVGVQNIPEVITKHFVQVETLGLKSNIISWLDSDSFENLTSLNNLDLSDNDLTIPDVKALETLVRRSNASRPIRVNLARNPFSCSCDLFQFLEMFKKNRNTTTELQFVGDLYRCHSPDSLKKSNLSDLTMTRQMCLLSVEQEIFISTICILVIGGILLYALLHRYRWQVRFWLYALHVRLSRGKNTQERQNAARFNAFVSYCQRDSRFVLSEVLPALEKGWRLPLCIHERDFVAGTYFSENIIERMAESRHVLMVLSNAFLQDDWCRFELFVAQRYGLIKRRIPITVLMLEPLELELLEPSVVLLLQSVPGLEWPGERGDTRARDVFWCRLGRALNTPV